MMSQTPCLTEAVPDDARRLDFKLERTAEGRINVAACEIINPNFANRTMFHGDSDIWSVLADELAVALVGLTEGLGDVKRVISLPEFCVEMPALTLSGLHLFVSDLENGSQKITARFQIFLGALGAVLRSHVGFSAPTAMTHERVALDVLTDLAQPLLDLCQLPEEASSESEPTLFERQRSLAERASEIGFYIELLKRFQVDDTPALQPEPLFLQKCTFE